MNQQLDFFSFPENPFTPNTHNHRLYEHLRTHRAVTTRELHHVLYVETARLRSDIRPYLRKHGLDYECKSIPGDTGNRLYKVVS